MTLERLNEALRTFRTAINKKEVPVYWIEFFLLVAAAGNRGITTKEVAGSIGMIQGVASRMVKLMSSYIDPVTKKKEGCELFITRQDDEYRHRQQIILSPKGKLLAEEMQRILAKEPYEHTLKGKRPSKDTSGALE